METKVLKLDRDTFTDADLEEAGRIIRSGGLVAFPTETVYGLGGNALDPLGSGKIYAAKGRPSDNPLIAHIADMDGLYEIAENVSDKAIAIAEKFWPGPITIVFNKKEIVPKKTTGGLDTVAVRMPSDKIANALIRVAGVPIAAPSANISGRPSPTKAEHCIEDLTGKIEMIIDGGAVNIGVESTIVDATGDVITLLRPGAITVEMLKEVVGEVAIDPAILGPVAEGVKPKAPGMKYKHYAPKADLTIVTGDNDAVVSKIIELVSNETESCGIITTEENEQRFAEALDKTGRKALIKIIGTREDEATVRHNLFAVLRDYDETDVKRIYSEGFADMAIMNRLSKAAGYSIMEV